MGGYPPQIFFSSKKSKRNTRRNPLRVCCFGRGLPPKISPNILFPRNFSEGKTAAADCQGVLAWGWGGGVGRSPLQKKYPPQHFCSLENFPEGGTAAAGRQGLLEGGWRRGGSFLPKICSQEIIFPKIFPETGTTATAARQGLLEGGRKAGDGGPSPSKKIFGQNLFPPKFSRMGHCGRRPPEEEGGRSHPQEKFPPKNFPEGAAGNTGHARSLQP